MSTCSFCSRPRNEVKALVPSPANPKTFICDGCLREGVKALSAASVLKKEAADAPLPKPLELVAKIDEYVIGQTAAKQTVAAAVYKHYKRRDAVRKGITLEGEPVELQKSNILMIGPSGCGKTQVARTIARILKVPFHIGDATRITQVGYVGDDPETLLQGLLEKCSWDLEKAKWGIVVLDEVDKLTRKTGREVSGYRDVSGEGVQQALLKIIEGGEVTISRGLGARIGDPSKESIVFDTSNVLFICMGSFAGIHNVVSQRLNKESRVGFGSRKREEISREVIYQSVLEEDIIEFGIIPELAGRLPVVTSVLPLSEDEMVRVLTEPKDALVKQIRALYAMDDVDLKFEDAALRAIAKKARERETGARALRGIIDLLMLPYDIEIPSRPEVASIVITADFVNGKAPPIIGTRPVAALA